MTSTSSSELPLPQGPLSKARESALPNVDTSKRYDVYCSEIYPLVVYRNVLFKSRSKLLSTGQYDLACEFWELEQANGQTVFLALHCVIKFCEHGVEPAAEIVGAK